MNIGVPKEIKVQEYRVALVPDGVRNLTEHGHTLRVEKGAGEGSGFSDEAYQKAGAAVCNKPELFKKSDLIVKVKEPLHDEIPLFEKGQILFTYLHLASDPGLAAALLQTGITGIAYETVQLQSGALPLLLPMSEIAGRLSVQAGAFYLQKPNGGKGILLSGLAGAARGHVVILGGGNVGSNAARIAIGLGARVTVLDHRAEPLRRLENEFPGKIETLFAYPDTLRESVQKADLLIGAALVPGAKAPFLVSRKMIAAMEKGSVAVDVSVDQGGCFETTRPTTHEDPVYELEGVLHYAVTNMPGAVPRTSTLALTNATLPYMMAIADVGVERAARADPSLLKGINFSRGKVNHPAVAEALAMPCESFI